MIWKETVSKSVRDYWESINYIPEDRIKAYILYHSSLCADRLLEGYREVLAETEDVGLKRQINLVLKEAEEGLKAFSDNDGSYVFILECHESGDEDGGPTTTGAFEQYEYAKAYMEQFHQEIPKARYSIEKKRLCKRKTGKTDDYDSLSQTIHFNSELELETLPGFYFEELDAGEYMEYFYNRYYDIPHPFRKGDILRFRNKEPHTFCYSYTDEALYAIVLSPQFSSRPFDGTDYGICIETFDSSSGRFLISDGPISPFDVEYAGFDYDNFQYEDPAYQALFYASQMLKGERNCSFQILQDACRCLRERNEENNKIGCFMQGYDLRIPYLGWEHT